VIDQFCLLLFFHTFECSFFLWAEIGCMVRIAAVEMAEKLSWSIRRSTTFSSTSTAASAFVPWMIATLVVLLSFGGFVWWSHELVLFLLRTSFLRGLHREHELRVFVLVILVVFLSLPHYPSLLDPSSVVCV